MIDIVIQRRLFDWEAQEFGGLVGQEHIKSPLSKSIIDSIVCAAKDNSWTITKQLGNFGMHVEIMHSFIMSRANMFPLVNSQHFTDLSPASRAWLCRAAFKCLEYCNNFVS